MMRARLHRSILLTSLAATALAGGEDPSEGEQLARVHCATCHSFPEPNLLPARSWKFTLSYMGLRMGIEDLTQFDMETQRKEIELIQNRKQLIKLEGAMPKAPLVSTKQWLAIRDYYLKAAPQKALPQAAKPKIKVGLDGFVVRSPDYKRTVPITSMIHLDEEHGEILIGDSGYESLGAFNRELKLETGYATKGFLWVKALKKDESLYLLSIGDLMGGAANRKLGKLSYAVREGGRWANKGIALDALHRPVDFALGDFDGDGKDELVVANFGFGTGSVDIHEFKPNRWQLEAQPAIRLTQEPGALACHVADFNGDGRPDIAALFGGAREHLSLFLNQGEGKFEHQHIIESHSAFGYVGFHWVDFDGDGDLDVFTLNGDNVDSDPYNTLKPYHGIRLYLNQGDLKFEPSYFYPMQGAYGMAAEDFDLDGDLDLAAVAFNPDFNAVRPESFVYLENRGELKFTPKTLALPKTDRWMTVGAGDLDGDGDKDLVLGGGYVPAGLAVDYPELMKAMGEKGRPLLILENRAR